MGKSAIFLKDSFEHVCSDIYPQAFKVVSLRVEIMRYWGKSSMFEQPSHFCLQSLRPEETLNL